MKKFFILIYFFISMISIKTSAINYEGEERMIDIEIKIKDKKFRGKLFDTPAGRAFSQQLPLTLNMNDLNNNEKYFYISKKIVSNSERVKKVKAGDIFLFGSDCIVLFYKDFNTLYSYTKLGYLINSEEINKFFEDNKIYGNIEINFELKTAD